MANFKFDPNLLEKNKKIYLTQLTTTNPELMLKMVQELEVIGFKFNFINTHYYNIEILTKNLKTKKILKFNNNLDSDLKLIFSFNKPTAIQIGLWMTEYCENFLKKLN